MMHPIREHVLTLILHCIIHKNMVAMKQYMYLIRNKLLLLLLYHYHTLPELTALLYTNPAHV